MYNCRYWSLFDTATSDSKHKKVTNLLDLQIVQWELISNANKESWYNLLNFGRWKQGLQEVGG